MKIKAAETLKGEVVLASIGRTLRAGQELPIDESMFWNTDVQTFLRQKRIYVSEGDIPQQSDPEERIAVRSLHKRPLELPPIPYPLFQNEVYTLTRKEFGALNVQQALQLKLLEEVAPVVVDPNFSLAPEETLVEVAEDDGEVDVDVEVLDEAEKFRLTGQAQTIQRPTAPKKMENAYVHDPLGELKSEKPKMEGSYIYDPHAQTTQPAQPAVSKRITAPAAAKPSAPKRIASPAPAPAKGEKKAAKTIKPAGRVRRGGSSQPQGGGEDLGGEGVEVTML